MRYGLVISLLAGIALLALPSHAALAQSADDGFNPNANNHVNALVVQADGRIVVGGEFTTMGGQPRSRIARLNPDGTLDTAFNPAANGVVRSLALQADGKILVGGEFSTMGGQPRSRIARLNADGSLDTTFNPEANYSVNALAVQADGRILVGGDFTTLNGVTRNFIGRLNANGTLDTTFNPGADGRVYTLALQADGKIVVGGDFTTLGGQPRDRIGRLNANGTIDDDFNPGAGSWVGALAVQPDGKIVVGGGFLTLGGQTRHYIGRLTNDTPALQNLAVASDGASVTWTRGGASPEVNYVTFERSTDGVNYTLLGPGTRVAGGWQLSGLALPLGQNLFIRARGYGATDGEEGSSWSVVESARNVYLTQAPTFTSANRTMFFVGEAGSFTVTVTGVPTPTITLSGTLPTGVTFTDNGNRTATLAGTPISGTAGLYPLTFTASNGVLPNATQNFTLMVMRTRVYLPVVLK